MSRSIEQIKEELFTVNIRLNCLVAESDLINSMGKRMGQRKIDLLIELEETKNA